MLINTTRQLGSLWIACQLCIFEPRSVDLQGPYLYLPFVGWSSFGGMWKPTGQSGEPELAGVRAGPPHLADGGRRRAAGKRGVQPQNTFTCPWSIRSTALGRGTTPCWPCAGRSVLPNCVIIRCDYELISPPSHRLRIPFLSSDLLAVIQLLNISCLSH
jgi:hypothetical protein